MSMHLRQCLAGVALAFLLMVPSVEAGGGGGTAIGSIAPLVATAYPDLDLAQRYALAVLAIDFDGQTHAASSGYYSNPWVRDSFAWGMISIQTGASLTAYSTSEIKFWLQHQQTFGGWLTARKSGYFDETAIFISAILDAYRVSHSGTLLREALPKAERGWHWLARSYIAPRHGSTVLLYANVPPHFAADWVDQIARTGYATQLEALWYKATADLATMEELTGHPAAARYFAGFAVRIKLDINRLLWTTSAPYTYRAAPVAPFGHYRSWLGPRDYFELDSNFLCILYGIAGPRRAASIVQFTAAHQDYLLGLGTPMGVPARVVYGDYSPLDYASKRNRIGQDQYQNAYWPSVGSLVVLALLHAGDHGLAAAALHRLADTVDAQGDFREWYTASGQGKGAPHFQWAARMFLIAVIAFQRSEPSP